MDDPGVLNSENRDRDRDRELIKLSTWERTTAFDCRAQRRTVHEFGDDIRLLGVCIDVQHRSGTERHDPPSVPRLPPEQRTERGVAGDLGPDGFEGDHPTVGILSPVDDAHAPGTEPTKKDVRADLLRISGGTPGGSGHDRPADRAAGNRTTGPATVQDKQQAAGPRRPIIGILLSSMTRSLPSQRRDLAAVGQNRR